MRPFSVSLSLALSLSLREKGKKENLDAKNQSKKFARAILRIRPEAGKFGHHDADISGRTNYKLHWLLRWHLASINKFQAGGASVLRFSLSRFSGLIFVLPLRTKAESSFSGLSIGSRFLRRLRWHLTRSLLL